MEIINLIFLVIKVPPQSCLCTLVFLHVGIKYLGIKKGYILICIFVVKLGKSVPFMFTLTSSSQKNVSLE